MDRDFQVDRMASHVTGKVRKQQIYYSTVARQTRIHMHTIRAEQTRSPSLTEDWRNLAAYQLISSQLYFDFVNMGQLLALFYVIKIFIYIK